MAYDAATSPPSYRRLARAGKSDAPHYTRGSPTLLSLEPADPESRSVDQAANKDWEAVFQHLESRF